MAAEKALIQARKGKPSLEAAQRIDMLLAQLEAGGEWQRTLLSLKLLEQLRSPPARELLRALAGGDPESRLTREANAALQRLGRD
jgi:hypothetical protein